MRQTNVRFILSATLLFAIALVSFDLLDGTLYAQTQGQAGTAAQDSQQPTQGSPDGVNGSQGSSQTPSDRPGFARQDQPIDNTQRAEGTPWGYIVLSFIAGTILGAVMFRRERPTMVRDRVVHDDRDDFRRSA